MKFLRKLAKRLQLKEVLIYVLIYTMVSFQTTPLSTALATPTGAKVVAGTASVTQTGNTTSVTLSSNRTVINWDSLDTTKNETLEFNKSSGHFAVLNRVVEGGATQFNGKLYGNQGHILVVNHRVSYSARRRLFQRESSQRRRWISATPILSTAFIILPEATAL